MPQVPSEDLKLAQLLVVSDVDSLKQKYRAVAAIFGCVILSGSILDGKPGVKLTYRGGFQDRIKIFVSPDFQRIEPGLTLICREACKRGEQVADAGWKAVSLQEAEGGHSVQNPCLVLTQNQDNQPRTKKVLRLNGSNFVAWAARRFVDPLKSGWIAGR